jgi:sterol desaturase/sphingolipid hydroxylase (fatty acid hydroxylase superfamily)
MNAVGIVFSIAITWPLNALWHTTGLAGTLVIPLWQWVAALGATGYVIQFLVLVIVADFLAYWRHRAEHRILWRIHAVHHSPRELHAAHSIGHPLQALFGFAFLSIPMSFIQVAGPELPFAVGSFIALLAFYIHSPIKLHFGPFRKVLVDNRFHRIHHSTDPRHFDKNFGICFSMWDRLFGTVYEPREEWPDVGLADRLPPRTVGEFLRFPFRQHDTASDDVPVPPVSDSWGANASAR